jgi:hypothetical protein
MTLAGVAMTSRASLHALAGVPVCVTQLGAAGREKGGSLEDCVTETKYNVGQSLTAWNELYLLSR